jgi:hypothetical protein
VCVVGCASTPGEAPLIAIASPAFSTSTLTVKTLAHLAGQTVIASQGGKQIGTWQLAANDATNLAQVDLPLAAFDRNGPPIELLAGDEPIATVPLYHAFDEGQAKLVAEALRTGDEKQRLERLRKLEATSADPTLRTDLAALLSYVQVWAEGREMAEAGKLADPTQYLSFSVDPLSPSALRSDSPLYPLFCLYRARNLVARALQGGEPEDIATYYAAARAFLQEARSAVPDNPIVNMYLNQPIPWQGPTADSKAPEWANAQRSALEQLADVVHFWIDQRQMPSGSFGGGWNDDVEMWRNWWPVMLAFADPMAEAAQRKLSTTIFEQEHMKSGYSVVMDVVEHSAEDSADTITPMPYLDPQRSSGRARPST